MPREGRASAAGSGQQGGSLL